MKEKNNSSDIAIVSVVLFFPAVRGYLCAFLNLILRRLGFPMPQVVFDTIVWSVVLLWFLPKLMRRLQTKHILIGLAFWCASILLYLLEMSPSFTTDRMIDLCVFTFPVFFIGSCLKVDKDDFKWIYWIATAVFVVLAIYQIGQISGGNEILADNMDFAYKMLPSALVLVGGCFYNKRKAPSVIMAILASVFMLMQGTRGPILGILVFICLMLYKKHGFGKILIRVSVVSLLVAVLLSSPAFMNGLLNVSRKVDDFGFSARFLDKLLVGELEADSGRGEIIDRLMADFEKDPIKIRGYYADRRVNSERVDVYEDENIYAHNILYELLYDFGLIIGGTLIILLLYGILRLAKKSNFGCSYLTMTFLICGFVKLLLSSSFLLAPEFFFMVGMFFNVYCTMSVTDQNKKESTQLPRVAPENVNK